MTFLFKLVAAVLFGAISFLAFAPTAALVLSNFNGTSLHGLIIGLVITAITLLICLVAPSIAKAWARGSLIAGALLVIGSFASKNLQSSLAQNVQTATEKLLSQAPPPDPDATFTITSVKVVPAISSLGTLFIIIGAILIIFGLVMEFRKRDSQ